MRELMKQIIHTHSAAKTFPYILEGLRSRNNRTRIECADLVGFLLDNYGTEVPVNKPLYYDPHYFSFLIVSDLIFFLFPSCQVSGQLKSLQIVASLTAERDGDSRKAALNALATGYKILGEFFFVLLQAE